MLPAVPFYFLRHGETDWNRDRRAQGQAEVPLNETGIAQAHAAKTALTGLGLTMICTSPLGRARATAEIVNEVLGLEIIEIDALKEVSFGPREGELRPPWFPDWLQGVAPEGVEPFDAFVARAIAGMNAALKFPGPVLIVGHGGVQRVLQRSVPMDMDGIAPNAVPLRHDPPTRDYPKWRVTRLGG